MAEQTQLVIYANKREAETSDEGTKRSKISPDSSTHESFVPADTPTVSSDYSTEELMDGLIKAVELKDDGHANYFHDEVTRCDRDDDHMDVKHFGYTPLHMAAKSGHASVVVWILKKQKEDVNLRDLLWKRTPLHFAARWGRKDCVRVLCNHGADVNAEDGWGDTPVHESARLGQKDCVRELLIRGTNINAVDKDGDTPLHKLCSGLSYSIVVAEMLLDNGGELDKQNKKGETPLQIALMRTCNKLTECLVEAGADLTLLGRDTRTSLIRSGACARLLLDQTRDTNLLKVDLDCVKSTQVREKRIVVKMVLIGQSEAGKTSLLRTLQKDRPELTPTEERTKGVELTVVKIDVNPEILLHVYDFGGQTCYHALYQLFISEGTLFTLVVDIHRYCLQRFTVDITHFFKTISHRIIKPVIKIICTKTDLCTESEIEKRSKEIFGELKKLEEGEQRRLGKRKRDLQKAIDQWNCDMNIGNDRNRRDSCRSHSESINYRFKHLSKEDLNTKIEEVDFKLHNRPQLPQSPKDIICISCKRYQGIDVLKIALNDDIKNFSPEIFPCMDIPVTWDAIRNAVNEEAIRKSVLTKINFSELCGKHAVHDETEVQMTLLYLKTVGRVLKYDDKHNERLDDIIFINPKETLTILACLFDHEHFHEKFWRENKYMKDLCRTERERAKRDLTERGIVSETVVDSFLMETNMKDKSQEVMQLLEEFDLCYDLETVMDDTEHPASKKIYHIPSLLKEQEKNLFHKLWPNQTTDSSVELVLKLEMSTDYEPVGFFEKTAARINRHLCKRHDMPKCTVASFGNDDDQKVKIEMLEEAGEWTLWLHVRVRQERIVSGGNKMRVLLIRTIDTALYYPSVLWDWYVVCPVCLTSNIPRIRWHLLPIENTVLPSINQAITQYTQGPYQCDTCKGKFHLYHGFPIAEETFKKVNCRKLETLQRTAIEMIGSGWRSLARELIPSLDMAESLIETVCPVLDLRECAAQILRNWSEQHGSQDAFEHLLFAVQSMGRNDIIQAANIDAAETRVALNYIKTLKQSSIKQACAPGLEVNCKFDLLKRTLVEKTGAGWRFLTRALFPSPDDAEAVIESVIHAHYRDLKECAAQMLKRWSDQHGRHDAYGHLLHAAHIEERYDIIHDAGIGDEEVKSVLEYRRILQNEQSKTRDALRNVLLVTSKSIRSWEWKILFRFLQSENPTTVECRIVEIDAFSEDLREKVYRMLMTWKRKSTMSATYAKLSNCLRSIDRHDIAEKVEDICKTFNIDTCAPLQE